VPGGTLTFTWARIQIQYATDAASGNWSNFGDVLIATSNTLSASNAIGPDPKRFYRVVLVLP